MTLLNQSSLVVLGLLAVVTSVQSEPGVARIEALVDFEGGLERTKTFTVSGDGGTSAGAGWPVIGNEAAVWRESSIEGLGTLGASDSVAYGVSLDGSVVVGSGQQDLYHRAPFVWRQDTGIVNLGFLSEGAFNYGFAGDVSDDNTRVVGSVSSAQSNSEAFVWSSEQGYEVLPSLTDGFNFNFASGISGDGSVIAGGASRLGGSYFPNRAVRWVRQADGTYLTEDLGNLQSPGEVNVAYGISQDGLTIIGASNPATRGAGGGDGDGDESWIPGELTDGAGFPDWYLRRENAGGRSFPLSRGFRWTSQRGMEELGALPDGTGTQVALAVSANGSLIVGKETTTSREFEAFLWREGRGTRKLSIVLEEEYGLDMSEWQHLVMARSISDDGRVIVGYGVAANGAIRGFRVTLPSVTPGDLDFDRDVDMGDLSIFLSSFGSCRNEVQFVPAADQMGDGCIDLFDLSAFLNFYGS